VPPILETHAAKIAAVFCEVIFMKNFKTMVAGVVVATASMGSGAMAADITTPAQALNLVGASAFFGDAFDVDQMGATFADQFTFSVNGAPLNIDAAISTVNRTSVDGVDITGLALFTGDGTQVRTGSGAQVGQAEVWTLQSNNLEEGDYYLQVNGTMLSNQSGSFGGSTMLAPVPEPAAFGLMLAGLGMFGFMLRRRGSK
jgi:hypothetical protein